MRVSREATNVRVRSCEFVDHFPANVSEARPSGTACFAKGPSLTVGPLAHVKSEFKAPSDSDRLLNHEYVIANRLIELYFLNLIFREIRAASAAHFEALSEVRRYQHAIDFPEF